MLNSFKLPELIKAETLMSMPKKFRTKGRTKWSDANRQGAEVDKLPGGPVLRPGRQPLLTARRPVAGKLMYGLAP